MQPDYIALVRVIVAETPRFPQLGRLFCTTVPEQMLKRVGGLLEQARAAGIVRFDQPDTAARLFVGPLLTYVLIDGLFMAGGPPVLPGEGQLDQLVSLFMRAVAPETR